ncbi:hypothetical protein [Brevundimonas sp.]|uniref:hypothetical protein n=1 Tax=Brevundimonas sp. TaxID=1871086 RepID=UPI003F7061DC
MDHGRQRCAHIGLHRVAQAHGLVGREVDDQPVGQGAPDLFRLRRAAASLGVGIATVVLDRVLFRGRRHRVLGPDQSALETGQTVVAEHHHDPRPRLGLGGIVEVRAEGLQGLVDLLQPRVRFGRQAAINSGAADPSRRR